MANRREILQLALSAAFVPALRGVPFLGNGEGLLVESSVTMSEASKNYLATVVSRYIYNKTDPYLHNNVLPAMLYKQGPRAPHVGWYLGHYLPAMTNLLTIYVSKGWEGHFDDELIASCIKDELERRKSFGNDMREVSKGIVPDLFSIFRDREAVRDQIEAEIDKAMSFAHGISNPSNPDFLHRGNLVLEYGHADRIGWLNTSYYRMRIQSDANHLKLSRNDLHLLAEFDFKRRWGSRSGVFSLTPEHETIMSTLEEHELSRLHQCYMAYPSALKKPVLDSMVDFMNEAEFVRPEFSEAEIKFFEQFDQALDIVTKDPQNYPSYRYVHNITLTFDELQRTLHRPVEFVRVIAKRTQDILNHRAQTAHEKAEVIKRYENVEFSIGQLVDAVNVLDKVGSIISESVSEVSAINDSFQAATKPLLITSENNDLEVLPLDVSFEEEKAGPVFEVTPA